MTSLLWLYALKFSRIWPYERPWWGGPHVDITISVRRLFGRADDLQFVGDGCRRRQKAATGSNQPLDKSRMTDVDDACVQPEPEGKRSQRSGILACLAGIFAKATYCSHSREGVYSIVR